MKYPSVIVIHKFVEYAFYFGKLRLDLKMKSDGRCRWFTLCVRACCTHTRTHSSVSRGSTDSNITEPFPSRRNTSSRPLHSVLTVAHIRRVVLPGTGVITIENTLTNELLYHKIERILQKYTNINVISYNGNEKV